jgi:hypothetical protein
VPQKAYYAMVDTVFGVTKSKRRTYKKDFTDLCSSSFATGVEEGCAMFALNLYGGDKKDISELFYQVKLI